MLTTKRKPSTVGEVLVEEFMRPLSLTQGTLANAMGVPRKHVNELCNDRRSMTAPTALILACCVIDHLELAKQPIFEIRRDTTCPNVVHEEGPQPVMPKPYNHLIVP